jgi:hypothetical protein
MCYEFGIKNGDENQVEELGAAMPVIECTCGMVMSLSAVPRNNCIRCGGVEFRVIESTLRCRADNCSFAAGFAVVDSSRAGLSLVGGEILAAATLDDGSHI